jgi:hypothetical protein
MLRPDIRPDTQPQGFALIAAIFALVVVGGIVASGFYLGIIEQLSGRNTLYALQAAEAAEARLRVALRNTSPSTLMALSIGGAPLELDSIIISPEARAQGSVSRLDVNLFLIRSRGIRVDAAGAALASRMLGMLVRNTRDSLDNADVVAPIAQRPWLQLY